MLQDMIRAPPDQLPVEDLASPINAQMFEFCDNELFSETLQNSEVSSCSNCCYEDSSSYTTNMSFSSFPSDVGKLTSNNSINSNTSIMNNNNNSLSTIFDSQDENDNDDITTSMNFFSQPTFPIPHLLTNHEDQFDMSTLQPQLPLNEIVHSLPPYSPDQVVTLAGPHSLPSVFDDDCLPALPSYGNLDPSSPSCSLIDPIGGHFLHGNLSSALSADASGIFSGSILTGTELQPHEYDFQGDNAGVYGSVDSLQQGYSSGDIQGLSNENQQQQMVSGVTGGGGGGSSNITSEISTLEESAYKIGRLSVEERKEKIHRYMKKRNERNFSKKIKYACRKTLADSRPRVRGRFAKNDDFGETNRPTGSNHEDEDDEEVTVKEEDDMIESSDIFAHISGVNSFKCNYPIQSWI